MDELESSPVAVTVLGVDRVRGRGRLLALAMVELEIDGVPIRLQGVQVLRGRRPGTVDVSMPCYRHTTGEMIPCVALPDVVEAAIAQEVVAVMTGA